MTVEHVKAFRDGLLKGVGDHPALSRVMARKVMVSFKSILKANGVAHLGDDVTVKMAGRSERQLEVGVDIPTRIEIARIIQAATDPRWRALLMTAAFCGLRASELRGLRWCDVDLKAGTVSVTQRADSFSTIGAPKTASSRRKIPIGPELVSALRNWKISCPKGDLVFPTSVGTVVDAANFWDGFIRAVARAGVVDKDGEAKYAPHSFRHFFASWCINRKADGGRELPAKSVQALLGHSSIVMTLDTYGHLFPSDGDAAELALAEASLLTATPMQLCGKFASENKG
jgi:integrase